MSTISKRSLNKKIRTQKILEAAESLFFNKTPENTTMDEIAGKARLSKATIYAYFKSKEEIILEIAKKAHVMLRKSLSENNKQPDGFTEIQGIVDRFFTFTWEYPDYYYIINYIENNSLKQFNEDATKMILDTTSVFEKSIKKGIRDGSIKKTINPEIISKTIWGMLAGLSQLIVSKESIIKSETGIDRRKILSSFMQLLREHLAAKEKIEAVVE